MDRSDVAAPVVARTLRLSCPPSDVGAVHDLVDGLWRRDGSVLENDRMRFETALVELTSAIVGRTPVNGRVVCDIHVIALPGTLEADLSDDLPGQLDPPTLAELRAVTDLTLVRALVDEVSYRLAGDRNTWRLVLRRGDAGSPETATPLPEVAIAPGAASMTPHGTTTRDRGSAAPDNPTTGML